LAGFTVTKAPGLAAVARTLVPAFPRWRYPRDLEEAVASRGIITGLCACAA
jgi:hypothetical protein